MTNPENLNPSIPDSKEPSYKEGDDTKESNHELAPELEAEQVLNYIEKTSNQSVEAALETAKMIEASQLPNERKKHLVEKLKKSLKNLFRALTFSALLTLSVVGTSPYTYTRYSVDSKINERGAIEYTHQDEETTHVINVLAGKEKFTVADRENIYMDLLTGKLEEAHKKGQYLDAKKDKLPETSIKKKVQIAEELSSSGYLEDEKLIKASMIDPSPKVFDEDLYSALWKLEQECGNPKVRFMFEGKTQRYSGSAGRSFYSAMSNTIFIDVGSNEQTTKAFIAELSHAKQFDENPINSLVVSIKDDIHVQMEASKKNLSFREVYDQTMYDQPGTIEYQAHQEIEPELKEKFLRNAPGTIERFQKEEEQLYVERDRLIKNYENELNGIRDYFNTKRAQAKNDLEYKQILQDEKNQTEEVWKNYVKKALQLDAEYGH